MNSNRNNRGEESQDSRRGGRSSYPEEGYNSGYGSSQHEPYRYGEERESQDYKGGSNESSYSNRGYLYGMHGGESSGAGPGYSTANDFSGQEPVRGRLHRQEHQQHQGHRQEDSSRRREMNRRCDYPDTYRSEMSGYMSEHVGKDRGRRDYNQNRDEGNLYGNRYRMDHGARQGDYQQQQRRGYMSSDDYEYGSPFSGKNANNERSSSDRERKEAGLHKGKGPRNYQRADTRILDDINDRLTEDPHVDASDIEVSVQNGEVTLSGRVDDREAKRRAEDLAESISGVKHVENRIKVGSGSGHGSGAENTPAMPVTPL